MKKQKFKNYLLILTGFLFLAGVAYIINDQQISNFKKLPPVEVKEYQGKDLSKISDFHENSIKGPQYINKDDYRLKILGLEGGEVDFAYDDIIKNHPSYQKVVTLNCVEGWSVNILWEGVKIKELIDQNKITADKNTVIFRAYDGYSTSFPLSYILDNDLLLAYRINGDQLPPERGFPFQLVAESKWGYKWIKWITEIEFSSDSNYQGYWESRGYSNNGDLDKNFFSN